MIHGHEVLQMMEGNKYSSKQELINAIHAKFGNNVLFFTCHDAGLSPEQLVDFFEAHGKFETLADGKFTVDTGNVCKH